MADERRDGVHEVKFPVPPGALDRVLGWMRGHLAPDPHGSGDAGDTYDVQSLYLDTPGFDVFHRRGSYGRAKFRLRRYGSNPVLFLERKLKRDGVVRKRRVTVDPAEVSRLAGEGNASLWPGAWFHHRVQLRRLQPFVMMNYRRVARLGNLVEGPVRVTLDRSLRAVRSEEFRVPGPIASGDLFESGGVLEVKFTTTLPVLVKSMVDEVGLQAGGMSKYRLGMRACGWVTEEAGDSGAGGGSETGR